MTKPRLFVDLDGVLFDFDSHFRNLFDKEPTSRGGVDDDELWRLVHGHGSFFRTMPLYDGAKDFWKSLVNTGLDPIILTAASKKHYAEMAVQKRGAVREHITTDHLILPVPGGSSKHLFMHAPNDILIDDWEKNCNRWSAAGGVSIQHKGNYEDTLLKLCILLTAPVYR